MNAKIPLLVLITILLMVSCKQPMDQVLESVNETNSLLQDNVWNLEEFTFDLNRDDIPPPLLFSTSDSLLEPGIYDLDDMVLDASEMRDQTVHFTSSRDILTSNGQIDLLGDSIGTYFVFNDRTIRISNAIAKLNYTYVYNENEGSLSLTLTDSQAESLIQDINDKLIDAISKKTPTKLGDLVAGLLYNNDKIQKLINDLVVSALAGKLEFIHGYNPDEAAAILANKIMEQLSIIDWEGKLTELLRTELEKITNIDPDIVAEEIAKEVATSINELLSTENIYNLLVPFLDELATNPEGNAKLISSLIVNKFTEAFSVDNIKPTIKNAWSSFTQLDEQQVSVIADTLTNIVEDVWINSDNLSQLFLPFTQKIDETSILQLGALAEQSTDSLKVLVDKINLKFPDLNLDPDYDNVENAIKAILISAKPIISIVGPEEVATDLASLIINEFLSTETLNQAFVSTINYLQELDPEIVGETIAAWLVNIVESISPEAIEFLSDLLSPILDNIDPEYTAFKIAVALNGFINENVTDENIKELILPSIEFISDINANAVAAFVAKIVLSLDIIEGNINEENITQILLPVLQSISEVNEEELVQSLIDTLVDSGIFEDVITEDRVSSIIAFAIYNKMWQETRVVNNFREVTIVL